MPDLLSPSWPSAPVPQQVTPPSEVVTQVCVAPADTVSALTGSGTLTMSEDELSPSWPSWFLPQQ